MYSVVMISSKENLRKLNSSWETNAICIQATIQVSVGIRCGLVQLLLLMDFFEPIKVIIMSGVKKAGVAI